MRIFRLAFAAISIAVIAGAAMATGINPYVHSGEYARSVDQFAPSIGAYNQVQKSSSISTLAAPSGSPRSSYNESAMQFGVVDQPAAADRRVWHDQYAAAAKSYGLSNASGVGLDHSFTTQPGGGPAQGISGGGGVF